MTLLFVVICTIIFSYGLIQIVVLLRQIRIINSMTLKAILKISEKNGINIDIQTIQKEVEAFVLEK